MRSVVLLLSSCVAAFAAVDFDREVRPILSDNCFTCHGPDASKRMANLRLDSPDGGAFANNIVVPGKSAESHLFQRISAADAKHMPPAASGRTLTQHQIDTIRQWIDQGAKWESHWAFVAPKRPVAPSTNEPAWVRNPIDSFIEARLEKEGMRHAPEADKATLLRRVTYDLTGLPPTVAEVEAFLADKSPGAYEKCVDRLLASPRYGERMAMQWLDLARYADTHGYHIDSHREMWHWRDWVINAYNTNMPYDRFTVEQLAGDLLPNATPEQKVASGFNRNHMINFEGGAIPEEYQVEYVVDRLEATSTAWMGLTLGCARCHDHKYDPIPQRDFYRFFAFFNNISEKGLDGRSGNAEPLLQLPSAAQRAQQEELKAAIAAHEAALPENAVAKRQAEWEALEIAGLKGLAGDGLEAHYEFDGSLADSSGHYRYGRVTKGDLTYSNAAVDRGADFDGQTKATLGHFAALERNAPFALALWLKVNGKLRDPVLRQGDGFELWLDDFELSGVQQRVPRLYLRLAGANQTPMQFRTVDRLPWPDNMNHIVVNYDGSGKAAGVAVFVNGARVKTETLPVSTPDSQPGKTDAATSLEINLFKGRIDDLRVYTRELKTDEMAHLTSQEPLRAILNILPDKRSKEQKALIRDYYLTRAAPESDRKAWAELKGLREDEKKLTAQIPTTMVMSELTDKPRETFILARGDYRNQTEKVTPGVPSVLPPLPAGEPVNRLSLA